MRVIRNTGSCLSYNVKELNGEGVNKILEECLIIQKLSPTYQVQPNPVEKVNKDVKIMISEFIMENHKKWDEYMLQIQLAHIA